MDEVASQVLKQTAIATQHLCRIAIGVIERGTISCKTNAWGHFANACVACYKPEAFQVITNVYDFNMPLKDAVGAMRFHRQLLQPNTIFWEPYEPIDGELAKQVEAEGYTLQAQDFNGDIRAIKINGEVPEPVPDPRGRGVTRVIP